MVDTITISAGGTSATATAAQFMRALGRPMPPLESDFERLDVEYLPDEALDRLGQWLIENKRALRHLKGVRFSYLWKKSGGKSGGKIVMGKCGKTPTLVKTFAHSTFTIWLAADHAREYQLTDMQTEALLFHELCHAVIEEVENEKTGDTSYRPAILAHDLEMFHAEVDEYGLWTSDLVAAKSTFMQQGLPNFGDVLNEAQV